MDTCPCTYGVYGDESGNPLANIPYELIAGVGLGVFAGKKLDPMLDRVQYFQANPNIRDGVKALGGAALTMVQQPLVIGVGAGVFGQAIDSVVNRMMAQNAGAGSGAGGGASTTGYGAPTGYVGAYGAPTQYVGAYGAPTQYVGDYGHVYDANAVRQKIQHTMGTAEMDAMMGDYNAGGIDFLME